MVPDYKNEMFDRVLEAYGAQMGEIILYDATIDQRIHEVSSAQLDDMRHQISSYFNVGNRPLRLLEVGAYQHYSMHVPVDELDAETVATDIAPSSLNLGKIAATQTGISGAATLVQCDFHDLPFNSDYFDFMYIASAVHRTWRPERVLGEMMRVLKPGGGGGAADSK